MWYKKTRAIELDYEQLVLTKCPDWCEEGFQVAVWNGKEFEFRAQPNDMFNEHVTDFMILSEYGDILRL
jgi:hypothetical protein